MAPVVAIMRLPNVLDVHPSVPAKAIPELIAYAKANPAKLNMASSGVGTSIHLTGELFKIMAAIDLVHNAATITYEGALVNRQADTARHVFDLNANTVTFALVKNAARHEMLDPSLRLIVDNVFGVSAGHRLPQWLAEVVPEGKHYAREAGANVIEPRRADREGFGLLVEPVIKTMLADLPRRGFLARQVYNALMARRGGMPE
jgi:hypothetical protein